jgi:phytoene synthase
MLDNLTAELPESSRLAFASAGANRKRWLAALTLDARLARIVAKASETVLAQMRLAWWRDQLGVPVDDRPTGDVLLDLIGQAWRGDEAPLKQLVDGWEIALCEPPLTQGAVLEFAVCRAAMFGPLTDFAERELADVMQAGQFWAMVDLASGTSQASERELLLDAARKQEGRVSLSRSMRPLTVLAGLARRSLRRGGAPLIGDRLSPLAALRLGMLGR